MNLDLDTTIRELDRVEASAYREMLAAIPAALQQALGLETREIGGATLIIAQGIPSPQFNRVVGLGNEHPVSDQELEEIAGRYSTAGIKDWWVQVSPGSNSEQTLAQLAARGFTAPQRKSWVKVIRGAEAPEQVESGAEVRAIIEGEETVLAEVICAAFGMPVEWAPWLAAAASRPNWRAVAAFREGQIVGGGLLHLQGEYGWLGAGGVAPEARRLHAHRALMNLRIELAIHAGCTRIVTETGEAIGDEPNPSLRNMYACGFTKAYSRLNLAAPA
jgi:GNAT superfamily N-acetyltransferase